MDKIVLGRIQLFKRISDESRLTHKQLEPIDVWMEKYEDRWTITFKSEPWSYYLDTLYEDAMSRDKNLFFLDSGNDIVTTMSDVKDMLVKADLYRRILEE